MVLILGIEIDLVSLVIALFGVVLSIINWLSMRKPANIYPTKIINYGLISSSYDSAYKLILPLIFHNEGANNGLIKEIKVSFKHGKELKYLDILGKANLKELEEGQSNLLDWDKFTELGYRMVMPTYPIKAPAFESIDTILIAVASYEENIVPIDKESLCIIEVEFGKNKSNKIEFPFYLAEDVIADNRIQWMKTITSAPKEEEEK